MDHPQMTVAASRTQRFGDIGRYHLDGVIGGSRCGGKRGGWEKESPGSLAVLGAGRAGQPVVTDLGKAPRQDVVEEAVDEFLGWYTHVAELLGAVVAITEGDLAVLEGFDPAVGDGDPEDIARQVLQDLGAGSGVLGVDDPGLPPHLSGDLVIEAQGLEGIAHLGAEDDRESPPTALLPAQSVQPDR